MGGVEGVVSGGYGKEGAQLVMVWDDVRRPLPPRLSKLTGTPFCLPAIDRLSSHLKFALTSDEGMTGWSGRRINTGKREKGRVDVQG